MSAEDAKHCMLIRAPGTKPHRLYPGEKLQVGRESGNDIVLKHGSVSRRHAEIVWDKDEDRPYVRDLGSANGVEVDGEFIEPIGYLSGGNSVIVGEFTLACELRSVGGGRFLNERDEAVTLFQDRGRQLKGVCEGVNDVRRLFAQLEQDERTGTLTLTKGRKTCEVMFSMGQIVYAKKGDLSGEPALLEMFELSGVSYHFSKQIRPVESTQILSAIELLERELQVDTRKLTKPDA
ncbi:MAG: FHA domain-containing protein [Planctomycetota bacterium]